MPVLTPDLLWLTAEELRDCVCAALEAEFECGCPCRNCVVVGEPAWDDCCEGQLTVNLTRLFYHENFPQAMQTAAICSSFLGADFKIQYLRCAPVVKDDGSAPNCSELSESARLVYQSLYIAARALSCCLAEAKRHRKYLITEMRPVGPQGGCVGWEINVTIEAHDPLPPTS